MDTKLLDLLQTADSLSQLVDIVNENLDLAGFHHWAYCVKFPADSGRPPNIDLHNFPPHLWEPYQACNAVASDPISARCKDDVTPEAWLIDKNATEFDGFPPEAAKLFQAAQMAGVRGGVCVPIRDHGVLLGNLTLSTRSDIDNNWLQNARSHAMLFAAHLHQCCKKFINASVEKNNPQLSNREIECLSWASRGKTSWEISRVLSISERTVVFHLQNAKNKLGAVTRQQAVAISLMLGLLVDGEALASRQLGIAHNHAATNRPPP